MKKYTVYNYLYGEMDTPSHKMFLLMDDGVKFDVDLYKLSYEDRNEVGVNTSQRSFKRV